MIEPSRRLSEALTDPSDNSDEVQLRVLKDWLDEVSRDLELDGTWEARLHHYHAEFNYEEPTFQLRLQIREASERAWFFDPDAKVAIYANSPDGRDSDPEAGRTLLRRFQVYLNGHRPAFLRATEALQSARYARENLDWFEADHVSEAINRGAFHILNIFKYGANLEKVRRPGSEHWYSVSSAELYPWAGAVGTGTNVGEIRDAWRRYADGYEEHQLPLSLYMHIPFCARICNFCHCVKQPITKAEQISQYVDALIADVHAYGEIMGSIPLTTLYLGGGTPSVLSPEDFERLLVAVKETFTFADNFQFSIEANPDSLTRKKLAAICDVIPIDRLSIGIQTLDPAAQVLANRHNSPERIQMLVDYARERDVGVIHFDLIAGLDGLLYENFQQDLKMAAAYGAETVKVYSYRPFRFVGDSLKVVVDQDVVERRMGQVRWAEKFLRRTHDRGLGVSAEAVRAQRNLQIDYTYEHTAAMLSIGISGISYIPFEMYYEVPTDLTGYIDEQDALVHPAVPTSLKGDLHGTLVKSIQMGIDVAGLEEKFGTDNVLDALSDWALLAELGVWFHEGKLVIHTSSVSKIYLIKYFFSAPDVRERLSQRFDENFDPSINYFTDLARLLDGEIMLQMDRLKVN